MLDGNRFGQPGVIGAKFEFQGAPADSEASLKLLDPRMLARFELKLFMQQVMQFRTRLGRLEYLPSSIDASQRGRESDRRNQKCPRDYAHPLPANNVDGARGGAGPNSEKPGDASAG